MQSGKTAQILQKYYKEATGEKRLVRLFSTFMSSEKRGKMDLYT